MEFGRIKPILGLPLPYERRLAASRWVDSVFVCLLPLLQLGFTYYASVSALLAVLVLYRLRRCLMAGLSIRPYVMLLVPLMFIPLAFHATVDFEHDLLRSLRESLIAVLLMALLIGVSVRPIAVDQRRLMQLLFLFMVVVLIMTTIQLFALRFGIYFGFPQDFYVQGADTIPDELDLRYSDLRPAATYAEPSYFAFILLSIMVIALTYLKHNGGGLLLVGMIIACGLLSRAASFALFAGLIGGLFVVQHVPLRAKPLYVLLGFAGVVLLMALGSDTGVASRILSGASSQGDASIFARIFGPLEALPSFLTDQPLGAPASVLPDLLDPFARAQGVDSVHYAMNGFFNLFFEFGIISIVIIPMFLSSREILMKLYVLFCMLFNGSFLAIDKLAVVAFTLAVCESLRLHAARRSKQSMRRISTATSPRVTGAVVHTALPHHATDRRPIARGPAFSLDAL